MAKAGRPPGPGEKPWRDAIRRAVNARVDGKGNPQALEVLAEKVVMLGLGGDMAAIAEIGNRLDGKPAQAIVGDNSADPINLRHIERIIVDPAKASNP